MADAFADLCGQQGLGVPETEYVFAADIGRRWRIDWAWPEHKIALEHEGLGGRHQTVKGFRGDIEKYNELACRGWRIIRVTTTEMKNGNVFELLRRVLSS